MRKPRNYCSNAGKLCQKKSKAHCVTLAKTCISPVARKRAAAKLVKIHSEAAKLKKASPGMKYSNAVKAAAKKLKTKK